MVGIMFKMHLTTLYHSIILVLEWRFSDIFDSPSLIINLTVIDNLIVSLTSCDFPTKLDKLLNIQITRLEAPSRVPLPSFLLISNMVMVIAIMSLCFGANLYLKVKLKAMYITDECYPATEEEEEKHPEI